MSLWKKNFEPGLNQQTRMHEICGVEPQWTLCLLSTNWGAALKIDEISKNYFQIIAMFNVHFFINHAI